VLHRDGIKDQRPKKIKDQKNKDQKTKQRKNKK
jgi:hypothetical protein